MPEAVALPAYREHADFYDQLQRDVSAAAGGRAVDPDAVVARAAGGGRLAAITRVQAGAVA